MSKNQYAVIQYENIEAITQDLDNAFYCTIFDDYEKAKAYLNWKWEDNYNEEIAAGSDFVPEECYHEDEYAKISMTDGCFTEFILTKVSEPHKNFTKEYKNA